MAANPARSSLQAWNGDRLLGGGHRLRALRALIVAALLLGAGQAAAGAEESLAAPALSVQGPSIVAQARGHVVYAYRFPSAKRSFLRLTSPNADGEPLVFLVKSRRPGWVQVRLPRRPNGSTAWVRNRAVALALNPYRVRVSLGAHRITVWKGRRVIDSEPAGVGRSVLPTPGGIYFVVSLLKQPNPYGVYGPYAFGLSAYSNVLFSFGGGPGQIGLHGTNEPWALGTEVSHGCIRISNAGISKLASVLPLGTPVQIAK